MALTGVLALVAAVYFVFQYSFHLYKQIPQKFGGGEPEKAFILFSKSGLKEARQLNIPLRRHTQKSQPVDILLVDESFYAVQGRHSAVVQIPKTNVDGLQVDSQDPSGDDVQTSRHAACATPGRPEVKDRLVLTYAEAIDANSIFKGWSGKHPLAGKVELTGALIPSGEELRFVERAHESSVVPLGTIDMSAGAYNAYFEPPPEPRPAPRPGVDYGVHGPRPRPRPEGPPRLSPPEPYQCTGGRGRSAAHWRRRHSPEFQPVTLRQEGARIVVVLDRSGPLTFPKVAHDVMTWTPSRDATDLTGNHCDTAPVRERRHHAEQPANDPDF